ncbi:MAG: type I polyketide synthase, partial [Desulfovibrio sp.]|nr:type I polyketide synthase [Desulfovibrio sp.]
KPIPNDRWATDRFYHPRRSHPGCAVVKEAGLIDGIYDFDAEFFGISPKEAEAMDPQQRLLLELTWEAFEDANLIPSKFAGSDTAVFVGAASPDAGTIHADDICASTAYSMLGTNLSIIANRISYIFDFHGPSFTLDTACSSGMYALYQACQILNTGGASLAVCAACNVLLAPYAFVGFSKAHMLSPSGRCKVFDAEGDGYVRAEGGGVLLLETLDAALKAGHPIQAVIKAIGTNCDGRTSGIALPSSQAQEDLLKHIYAAADCAADSLSFLEAHGTGTSVGDPLEAQAIGRSIGVLRSKPLYIGSVKCHVGHLETASAMAGIFKSLVMLQKKQIPAQIHIQKLNPAIDFQGLNLQVPLHTCPLPQGTPCRIGINSFGFGGANGHLILEEAPKIVETVVESNCPPIFLSAKSPESLVSLRKQIGNLLLAEPGNGAKIASTLVYGRELMAQRLVVDGADALEIGKKLLAPDCKEGVQSAFGEKIAFVFAGNGCHWLGMGRDLMNDEVFSAKAKEVSEHFAEFSKIDLTDLLLRCSAEDLDRTEVTQPLIFLIQLGLVAMLEVQGIKPNYVLGHSVGEVAAVCAAGKLSLADACRVVYFRSLFQGKTRGYGRMAAVKLSEEDARELANSVGFGEVEVASINGPNSLTLCGSEQGLNAIKLACAKRRCFFKMLPLAYAFHSQRMDSIKDDLLTSLQGLRNQQSNIGFISSVQPNADDLILDAKYWWYNIRKPVLFHAAVTRAIDLGVRFFLEISPHMILQQYIRSAFKTSAVQAYVGACMQRNVDNYNRVRTLWQQLWVHGWPLERAHFVSKIPFLQNLPKYPWHKQTCRLPETPESQRYLSACAVHPLLGYRLKDSTTFENVIDLERYSWIGDHKVGDIVFYPAACFLEMGMACAREVFNRDLAFELQNMTILRPLIMDTQRAVVLKTQYEQCDGELRIFGRPFMQESDWVLYTRGRAVKTL